MSHLPQEISREIDQVARFGKAKQVKELMSRAVDAYEQESFAEALAPAMQAKDQAPRAASVRELLGLIHYRLGRWREAARELATYRRLSGRRDQDHVYADCERALGRPEKALEILDELDAAELGEDLWMEGLIVAAGALVELGRPDEAVARLEKGPLHPREIEDRHLRLFYALADALEAAGRRVDARGWWDLIYATDPEFYDVADRRLGIRR